jgi:hypothetical protein
MFTSLKRAVWRLFRSLFGGSWPIEPPVDPCVGVRQPKRRGPPERRSAVAVEEPD